MWMVLTLQRDATVATPFGKTEVPFSSMADGCVGVCLVFADKEKAVEYANDGQAVIIEVNTNAEDQAKVMTEQPGDYR